VHVVVRSKNGCGVVVVNVFDVVVNAFDVVAVVAVVAAVVVSVACDAVVTGVVTFNVAIFAINLVTGVDFTREFLFDEDADFGDEFDADDNVDDCHRFC
jgi:hypothetical protein